ncbi:MAG: hypothetical protein R2793_10080 [Flavobacteriaceae bacterium]
MLWRLTGISYSDDGGDNWKRHSLLKDFMPLPLLMILSTFGSGQGFRIVTLKFKK